MQMLLLATFSVSVYTIFNSWTVYSRAIPKMVSHAICIVVAIVLAVTDLTLAGPAPHPAKKYAINLDTRPEERWTKMATEHSKELRGLISSVINFVEALVPKSLVEMIRGLQIDIVNDLPYPYGAELLGVAKAANLSAIEAFLANVVYELTAFDWGSVNKDFNACTSIIAQTTNGTIYHVRNMDYGYPNFLRNLTVEVDFLENGVVSYTGTTFVGYVGLLTGQKPNKFTVTLNQRSKGMWWMNLLEAFISGTHGLAAFLIRDILAHPLMDFKSAVDTLSSTPFIASSYIIVAGVNPNEGVVITRGRPRATDMWWLGSNHTWYLIETNYDHWEAAPSFDDRREPAHNAMREMGQANVTATGLWRVLSTPLVANSGTIYSVVMSAGKPEIYSTRICVWN